MIEKVVKMGISLAPSQLAFRVARRLAARPRRAAISQVEATALGSAKRLRLGTRGRLPAWSWGVGPPVALVHGWGGRASQMAPLAVHLAKSGFTAIVFDVAGHGESAVEEASWEGFLLDISDAAESRGPLAGFVGHSAGGLAMMASRALHGLTVDKYICVCAPHHPYPPIRGLQQRLNPGEKVLQHYRDYLGSQFRSDWHSLESGVAWRGAGRELLLCYDEKDRFIESTDGDRIHALCPGSTLIKTSQYGHARILTAQDTAETVTSFMKSVD